MLMILGSSVSLLVRLRSSKMIKAMMINLKYNKVIKRYNLKSKILETLLSEI